MICIVKRIKTTQAGRDSIRIIFLCFQTLFPARVSFELDTLYRNMQYINGLGKATNKLLCWTKLHPTIEIFEEKQSQLSCRTNRSPPLCHQSVFNQ